MPTRLFAIVAFDGHPEHESYGPGGLSGLAMRVKDIVETHPTLSFRTEHVELTDLEDWTPTDELIEALPMPLRQYISQLQSSNRSLVQRVEDYRAGRVWSAAYGAAFTAAVELNIRIGRDPFQEVERMAESADAVAQTAVEQMKHGNF